MAKEKDSNWMQNLWRPMMGWMYMLICLLDMAVFPVLWSLLQAMMHSPITQWNPLTLQGAGLFHIAMGAVLGISAFGRTQEKLAGTAANPTATENISQQSITMQGNVPNGYGSNQNNMNGGFGSSNSFGNNGFGGGNNGGFGSSNSFGNNGFGGGNNGGFGSSNSFGSPAPATNGFGTTASPSTNTSGFGSVPGTTAPTTLPVASAAPVVATTAGGKKIIPTNDPVI
jgi:hypothetical protein